MISVRVTELGRTAGGRPLPASLSLSVGATLSAALDALAAANEGKLPVSSLVIVSGRHAGTVTHHEPLVLRDGDELLLLSPVAGG